MKKTVVFHSYVNVSLPEGSNVLYMHHLRHAAIQHQSQEEHGACEERISRAFKPAEMATISSDFGATENHPMGRCFY